MRRRGFKVTFETFDEVGETSTATLQEFNVSDKDLAQVELSFAGLIQDRVELGQKKLNPPC